MHLALATTVYPGVEPLLPGWYESVRNQSDQGFDLWIASDGLSETAIASLLGEWLRGRVVEGRRGESPASIRSRLYSELAESYEAVVFVDSDDVLEAERVQAAREYLEQYEVAGCSLRVMNEAGKDLGVIFGPAPGDDWRDELDRVNVFGLSNSAYRSHTLSSCLPIPEDCVLIDWHLVTRALDRGARLGFDPTPRMWYRQYSRNTAPILPPFTEETVRRGTARVLGHYDLLLRNRAALSPQMCDRLDMQRQRVRAFEAVVVSSPQLSKRYVSELNQLTPRGVWWWYVAHPQLEPLWRS